MSAAAIYLTELPGLKPALRGKVRDVYDLGEALLLVATDRLSAFDCVFPDPIPDKGKVLNQLSAFWFARTRGLVPNHVITTDVEAFPEALRAHAATLSGRSTMAKKLAMLPIECVARGYLSGSGWKDYQATGEVCGIGLPRNLRESDRLPMPLFTPATKAQSGHDLNISEKEAAALVGQPVLDRVRDLTLRLYAEGAAHAESCGIIVADTKFEFGLLPDGRILLIDEMLTPDSSRFWPRDSYNPGGAQKSFDKQFVRDYLERIRWNKQPPVPSLPDDVVMKTREKYVEAFRRLTGQELQ